MRILFAAVIHFPFYNMSAVPTEHPTFIYAYQRIFLSEILKLPDGVWQFEMSHHGGMLLTFDKNYGIELSY